MLGPIILSFSMLYLVMTLPGETASTATAIRWAGMGITMALIGIGLMLSGILAVLIERFKNENHASGGGTRLRDDRPNESVEP
ncbi:hypothetical protein ABZU75_16270 [Streptosporangium sp. NPDC005286]|uniref:hypothetical protein n=1 Tax=Streptosporangium sp. NPDC005286 TaxID=3154463 RepID=UPI0033B7B87A